jgi:Ser/Thr protein kinase RdoA (MazF antagonist)
MTNENNAAKGATESATRIIQRVELSTEDVARILAEYNLSSIGEPQSGGGGRIASNLFVPTKEIGEVIVRSYPQGYGAAKVRFEAGVLGHLSHAGLPVPTPVNLKGSQTCVLSTRGVEVFVYPVLPGTTVLQSELTTSVARAAGKMLASVCPVSMKFRPGAVQPHGDIGFISGLLRAAKERDSALASHEISAQMEEVVSDGELGAALARSSLGIVHADYFFENVLMDPNRRDVTGVLDFGDAYYGYVVGDAIIGAMEFAVEEDETWNLAAWHAFLEENRGWLAREGMNSRMMRRLLLANCVRFAMYTLPFSYAEGQTLEANKYVVRFEKVRNSDLGKQLEAAWDEALSR